MVPEELNAPQPRQRLAALERIRDRETSPARGADVNNHIHTTYSFSPYTPAAAVYMAWRAGLTTAGIMDHDTIAGAEEFIRAGEILGVKTTVGLECRVSFAGTPLQGRRHNNPDQTDIAYMAIHGVPHGRIGELDAWFAPFRALRDQRNRRMLERINEWVTPCGIPALDYDRDVLPLAERRGTVTERHLLFALARALLAGGERGRALNRLRLLGVTLSPKAEGYLRDEANPNADYDLLMALKGDVSPFFIEAREECPNVRDVLRLCEEIGAISAYAYLGDVGESPTGDKRAQAFEDGYLPELFDTIRDLGYRAVTYMPSRNTAAQLARVRPLCEQYGLLQISGEDINSPRQGFVCPALRDPAFHNLIENTYALIGHERLATRDEAAGMFRPRALAQWPDLPGRVAAYANFGREE